MLTTIGMAVFHGHEVSSSFTRHLLSDIRGQFQLPPFLISCIRGEPLHPQEEICSDAVRPSYAFPWWISPTTFPPEGVDDILQTSLNWYRWISKGGLPTTEPHLETSKLSPVDIELITAQLEEARQRLLDRIAHCEAEEAWTTEEIASWEDLVYKSATLDVAQHRVNHMS